MRAAKGLFIILALALVVAAGLALRSRRPAPEGAALGAAVFRRDCVSCHGAGGEGLGLAPPLNATGHAHHHPDWELYAFIAKGRVGVAATMPSFEGDLSEEDILAVISYVKTLWTAPQRRFQEEVNRARPSPP